MLRRTEHDFGLLPLMKHLLEKNYLPSNGTQTCQVSKTCQVLPFSLIS
jgi:hypothetical protein